MTLQTHTTITAADLDAARAAGTEVILATGSRPVPRWAPGPAVDALAALSGCDLPGGPAVVHDPVGGPVGVAVAEWLAAAGGGTALLEDVWTGERRRVDCAVLIDCGHRLPDEELYELRPGTARAGDCVAPRSVHEAVLEGRRAVRGLAGGAAR